MLATIMRRGPTWPWIRMRPFLAQFSEPVWSGHLPSWADFITATSGFRFSVYTAEQNGHLFCPSPQGTVAAEPKPDCSGRGSIRSPRYQFCDFVRQSTIFHASFDFSCSAAEE